MVLMPTAIVLDDEEVSWLPLPMSTLLSPRERGVFDIRMDIDSPGSLDDDPGI
jgi:hypothetical protein